MKLRVAIIGDGAVAAIHARQLAAQSGVALSAVCGVDGEKTAAFAQTHGIPQCVSDLREAITLADAAIICSPSPLHFAQARICLEAGLHTLVELPPCDNANEAELLFTLAQTRERALMCAHTSRFLAPFVQAGQRLKADALGAIRQINYTRHIAPRLRDWTDDALLHHAAHPLDLLLNWFDELIPVGCVTAPTVKNAREVALLARLPNRAPVSVSISYDLRLPHARLLLVGSEHTLETDGFSYLHFDEQPWQMKCEPQPTYEQAIATQDNAFLAACQGAQTAIPWTETIRLLRLLNHFQALAEFA